MNKAQLQDLRAKWGEVPGWLRTTIVLVSVVALLATVAWFTGRPSPLEKAHDACSEAGESMTKIRLGDDGATVTVDGIADDNPNMSQDWNDAQVDGFLCLMDELDVSEALRQDMSSTTSFMGRQSASENGLMFKWSYHPEAGVSMTIRLE